MRLSALPNLVFLAATTVPGLALAEGFERPVPAAQSATAEISYALATLSFLVALWLVHRLVQRK
ncbi:hypothetical protein E2L08_11155 [Palleronia sediminis]|uniref:Uncharacterized protein n=1 Tax=Palleronia sediminis TaxID=2547833 RepID=A0A4R6A6C5_9RHOB|nr:hypothetical protein [Palleronia sediminis]TDL78257.1 hypothetical protein E2L08_11155 [Palleronia sediminis]